MHEMGPCGCLHTIIFTMLWVSSSSSAKAAHSHHRPVRANCLRTTVHEIGPCEWLRVIAFRLLGANSSSSAMAVRWYHGPMRAFLPAAILLTENFAGPCDNLVRPHCIPDGPIQTNCLSTTMHEMDPCRCLHTIIFTLLWASSSSLARTVHSHHGPMRANCLSTAVHEIGPCEWLHVIVFRLLQANSSSSAMAVRWYHGPMRAFLPAAIPLTENYASPRDSLVSQPAVFPMGQCELIV